MSTRVMTAHIPVDLADKVDRLAAQYERPRGWIIKQALREWVVSEEERDRLTVEAIAAADAGDVIDNTRASAWIRSLGTNQPLPRPESGTKG